VLRCWNSQGVGSTSDVISAIQFATANKNRARPRHHQSSLGHAIFESAATDRSCSRAGGRRGCLVVFVSAGNYGTEHDDRNGGLRGNHLAPGDTSSPSVDYGRRAAQGTSPRPTTAACWLAADVTRAGEPTFAWASHSRVAHRSGRRCSYRSCGGHDDDEASLRPAACTACTSGAVAADSKSRGPGKD